MRNYALPYAERQPFDMLIQRRHQEGVPAEEFSPKGIGFESRICATSRYQTPDSLGRFIW
jgi:hypothetical protein